MFLAAQETEIIRKQYTKIADAYGCLGVLQLNAGESSVLYLVLVTGGFSVGKIGEAEIFRVTQTQFVSLQYQTPNEEKISEVIKYNFILVHTKQIYLFLGKKSAKLGYILFFLECKCWINTISTRNFVIFI